MAEDIFHYTDRIGFNGIRSTPIWLFKAAQPPCDNPFGAYFTILEPSERQNLKKLRMPRKKREFCFGFVDVGDLKALRGDRGAYVFYSASDYVVTEGRQRYSGRRVDWKPS